MLFLAGAAHGRCEKAKRTRRYLLGHRRILKKGRLYHTLRKSIFSKGKRRFEMQYFKTAVSHRKADLNGLVVYASAAIIKRKEPINRVPVGYGLSALRLCVWLFDNCCMKLFYLDDRFVFAPRTKQRKVFKDRVFHNLCFRFCSTARTENPFSLVHHAT